MPHGHNHDHVMHLKQAQIDTTHGKSDEMRVREEEVDIHLSLSSILDDGFGSPIDI
jgi:hypothetical protein